MLFKWLSPWYEMPDFLLRSTRRLYRLRWSFVPTAEERIVLRSWSLCSFTSSYVYVHFFYCVNTYTIIYINMIYIYIYIYNCICTHTPWVYIYIYIYICAWWWYGRYGPYHDNQNIALSEFHQRFRVVTSPPGQLQRDMFGAFQKPVCYWKMDLPIEKWWFSIEIEDLPMKNGDFP